MTNKTLIQPNELVMNLATSFNFDNATFVCEWKGFNVFAPCMKSGETPMVGQPLLILSSKTETRMAMDSECDSIFEELQES